MGGRGPGRLEGRWAQGRLGWRRRLWVEWEESAGRAKSRVMGHGSVSGLSVRTGFIRAGGWSCVRLGSVLSVVCTSANF